MGNIEYLKRRMKCLEIFINKSVDELEQQNKISFNTINNEDHIRKISNTDFIAKELDEHKKLYEDMGVDVNIILYDINIVHFSMWIVKHSFQYCLTMDNINYLNKLLFIYYLDIKIVPNI